MVEVVVEAVEELKKRPNFKIIKSDRSNVVPWYFDAINLDH